MGDEAQQQVKKKTLREIHYFFSNLLTQEEIDGTRLINSNQYLRTINVSEIK